MLPFPSDVDHMVLRPMDFEEFLWACDERILSDAIREAFGKKKAFLLHEEAIARYHQYLVVGGMPLVASNFNEHHDFEQVRTLQAEIVHTYTADIALYAPPDSAVHVQSVWASIPKQLARETTRKFKYADVTKGGRERKYRTPLAWLEAAELVSLNYQTNDTSAPLVARDDGAFFKVYLADTGIMFYRLNISAETFLDRALRQTLSAHFRGALAENYVMQALVANNLETFYWTPGTTQHGEVEFVLQNRRGTLVPLEVKSGENVSSASLEAYRRKSKASHAIRLLAKNFGFENGILSAPLYAAYCIDERSILFE
jgi:predicted AAA+ superfamily ATPase